MSSAAGQGVDIVSKPVGVASSVSMAGALTSASTIGSFPAEASVVIFLFFASMSLNQMDAQVGHNSGVEGLRGVRAGQGVIKRELGA
jgi:hypothetical protein